MTKAPSLETLRDAAATAARESAKHSPQPGRGPRGAAALARNGVVATAPELAEIAGVGGPAECGALFRVLMEKLGRIDTVVIAGGSTGRGDGGPPTSAALQVFHEFFPKARIYWGTAARPKGGLQVRELLPGAFTPSHLILRKDAKARSEE